MTELRTRIEDGFERLAAVLCRRRWWVVVMVVAFAAGCIAGLPRLTMDMSNEGFLHPDDPFLARYDAFKEQFGRDDLIIIGIEPGTLFSQAALGRIKTLHEALTDRVPNLDDITSLVNARDTHGEGDSLIVDDLLRRWPDSPADMKALRTRVMDNPLYRDRLISRNGRMTTIVLELTAYEASGETGDALGGFDDDNNRPQAKRTPLSDAETRRTVDTIAAIVEEFDGDAFRLSMAGTPAVVEALKRAQLADMQRFLRFAVAAIGLCLLIMFRRLAGVVLPLTVVALALGSTLGLMGHLGVPVKVTTVILPSLLLAVGVGAAVHLLAIFFQRLGDGEDKRDAIVHALGHTGLPIVMTGLTTAAGLGSFATAAMAPVADFGVFAGLGVVLALVYTVILLPALLTLAPVGRRGAPSAVGGVAFDRLLEGVADFSTRNARAIVIVSVALIAVALLSASHLRFSHNVLSWLPADWPVSQATRKVDRELRGSVVLEVVLDTGRDNGLYDRDLLVKMDGLARDLETIERGGLFVGKATSVADVLKEINRALNGNRAESYAIPDNPRLIPQEFLLFENSGSDDLEDVVDSRFRLARFTIKVPWRDALEYVPLIRDVEARFRAALGPDIGVTTTGIMSILSRALDATIRSAATSYIVAFVVITLLMIALIGNLKLGLASMLPNLMPIILVMGAMWWLGLPLNMFTMMIGSVAIGLAVDDTIHFMHNFRRFYDRTGDVPAAVRQTLHTTGRAMLVTSVVLAIGFYIYLFGALNSVIQFGLLTGSAIVLALLADFILAPALMVVLNPAPSTTPALDTERETQP